MASALTAQQEQAACSIDENVLVAAGAGSGKTFVLVERYVEILRRNEDVNLSNIIAVTFTRKAASEMRSRLKTRFLALSEDPRELAQGRQERWLACLNEVDGARIGTIHSLCESIVRSYPAECSVDPQFEVFDELFQNELSQSCVDKAIQEVVELSFNVERNDSSGQALVRLLENFSIDETRDRLRELLKSSMQFRESLRAIGLKLESSEPYKLEDVVALLTRLANSTLFIVRCRALAQLAHDKELTALFNALSNLELADRANKLLPIMEEAQKALELLVLPFDLQVGLSEEALNERWASVQILASVSLRVGGNKEDAQAVKVCLKEIRELVKEACEGIPEGLNELDAEGMAMSYCYIQLFHRSYLLYQESKAELGFLDYNDLIELALHCLSEKDKPARVYFNEKLTALLIDEFQDTNDLQANLLSSLAGERTRVFLIGDDKQSIYRFQGADVATFNKWRTSFHRKDAGLNGDYLVTKLTRSFRSDANVVGFVNALFAKLLDGDPEIIPYVASFEPLEAANANASVVAASLPLITTDIAASDVVDSKVAKAVECADESAAASVEVAPSKPSTNVELQWLTPDLEDPVPTALKDFEALHLARYIEELLQSELSIREKNGNMRRARYGDIAILVSRNADFLAFEKAFARVGIPYVTFGGSGFLKRQEIYDFENLLRVLENPHDSHSLVAALRSPFFSVSDDVIQALVANVPVTIAASDENDQAEVVVDGNSNAVGIIGKSSLWHRCLSISSDRIFDSLRKAVYDLKLLIGYAALVPLSELLHKIIACTNYDIALMSAPDGRQRSRNVWKLVQLATQFENLSCGDFARRLDLMRQFNMKESEAPLDSSNAVKLMTIHASKGLEFPIVLLPCLAGQSRNAQKRLLFHPSVGIAFNTTRIAKGDKPAWYSVVGYLDKAMEKEEKKRLLYVAMTRARERLVMFLVEPKRDADSYRKWLIDELALRADQFTLPAPGECTKLTLGHATRAASFAVYTARALANYGSARLQAGRLCEGEGEVDREGDASCDGIFVKSGLVPGLNLDLLEPIEAPYEETQFFDESQIRVTPRAEQSLEEFATIDARAMGTFFHALMENLSFKTQRIDPVYVENVAFNQGLFMRHPARVAALKAEGMRLLQIFFESRLYKLLSDASQIWYEQPYLITSSNYLRRPDLIFQSADGKWYLVDFKTDRIDATGLEARVLSHKEQLYEYMEDLKQLSGITLEPFVYFAQLGILFPV